MFFLADAVSRPHTKCVLSGNQLSRFMRGLEPRPLRASPRSNRNVRHGLAWINRNLVVRAIVRRIARQRDGQGNRIARRSPERAMPCSKLFGDLRIVLYGCKFIGLLLRRCNYAISFRKIASENTRIIEIIIGNRNPGGARCSTRLHRVDHGVAHAPPRPVTES